MKAIELNQRQLDRILTMSNDLFPKRNWRWFPDENGLPNGMIGHAKITNITTGRRYPAVNIHWFEFCVFYLMPRLTKKYKIKIYVDIPSMIENDVNIIDVAYRYYKKAQK